VEPDCFLLAEMRFLCMVSLESALERLGCGLPSLLSIPPFCPASPQPAPTQQPEWAFRVPTARRPTHSSLHAWLPTSSDASLSILPIFHGEFTMPTFFQFLQLTLLPLSPRLCTGSSLCPEHTTCHTTTSSHSANSYSPFPS